MKYTSLGAVEVAVGTLPAGLEGRNSALLHLILGACLLSTPPRETLRGNLVKPPVLLCCSFLCLHFPILG